MCIKQKMSSEIEYKLQLEEQRHMYAWCLYNIGGYSLNEAKIKASEFYKYEPASEQHRGLIFHDDAWHWAMLFLKGEQYWIENPEFKNESLEYSKEYERYANNRNTNT